MGDINIDNPQLKEGGKTASIPMRESSNAEPHTMLGNKALLLKIDKLRELNVGALVPLPQLVVVGDQSSGKSSVLESLTGFSFPRAAGLCTRYATQISVRRDDHESVCISIIPRPNATDAVKERLREFRRKVDTIKGSDLTKIFEDANVAMGIRPASNGYSDQVACKATTFSQDVLKIEISRRDGNNLTVIDVPGIFRAATPGLTTDSDITLVNDMVKEYMKNERTIIMAVIPSNVDIATQEILKLAKEADSAGTRTLGILTKPDLATENATQQAVFELLQGKRNDLHLGYYVVKNRGADDLSSSLEERNRAERKFFGAPPWDKISAEGRVGIEALRDRLSALLMMLTKREFPKVKKDISDRRDQRFKQRDSMGISRDTDVAQRSYLGAMSGRFQEITNFGLSAYYIGDKIFEEKPHMKLITRVLNRNEHFARSLWSVGHTREFQKTAEDENRCPSEDVAFLDYEEQINDYPDIKAELDGILTEDWGSPRVSKEPIMTHIKKVFLDSKGPELGTFNNSIIPTIFREQSRNWEPLVLQHISAIIFIVHQFAKNLMEEVCHDEQVRGELWETILLDRMCQAYKHAKEHAKFILRLEREGRTITNNPDFSKELQKIRTTRLGESLQSLTSENVPFGQKPDALLSMTQFLKLFKEKANDAHVCDDIHDILKSYYKVAGDRFVDVICLQVVEHDLLNGPDSPLHIFKHELIHRMEADELKSIAGEDDATKNKREKLDNEIKSLTEALRILRG